MAKYVQFANKRHPFKDAKERDRLIKEAAKYGGSYIIVDGCFVNAVFSDSAIVNIARDCGKAKDNSK